MKTISTTEFLKSRFKKVFDFYGHKGIAPMRSQIRIETPLVDGQGTYLFDLKKEILSATEKNLKRNDLFVVNSIGFYLMIEDSAKPGASILMTYPIQEVTTGTGDAAVTSLGFTTNDINAFYNGLLSIVTGTTVNVEDLPLLWFKQIPQTQQLSSELAQVYYQDSQFVMGEEIVFAGTQDHKIQVSFPTFATADYGTSLATGTTKIAMVLDGYKVPGGTLETYKVSQNPYSAAL